MTNQPKSTVTLQLLPLLIFLLAFALLWLTPLMVQAQETPADGEFCVRAFNDANGNGIRDLNEAPLQGGISANLMDANGIIIASALLDNAPTVARGLICFQFLPAGQYTIEVSSGDYRATTGAVMTDVVQAGAVPYVMEFGAQSLDSITTTAEISADTDPESAVMRVVLALAGAALAVVVMSFFGFIFYLIGFRGRIKRAEQQEDLAYYQRPAVNAAETGEFRRQ